MILQNTLWTALRGSAYACAVGLLTTSAFASLIVSTTPTFDTGTGFGTVPNVLTLNPGGNVTLESGCVAPSGAGYVLNSCGSFTLGAPAGGYTGTDAVGPNTKASAPTLSSLGITSYSDLQIVFNAIEPGNGNGSITLQNLTLAIFNPNGTLKTQFELAAPVTLDSTLQGNGKSGFPITISPAEIATAGAFSSTDRIGLAARLGCIGTPSATNACADAGAETFIVSSIGSPTAGTVPEPATYGMIASGLGALVLLRKRKIV